MPEYCITRDVVTEWLDVPAGSPYCYYVAAQLCIDLTEGDQVDLVSAAEATNDLGYNCMYARALKESPEMHITNGVVGNDTLICRAMGLNITPNMHHGMLYANGFFEATETREHNFLLIVYAASTAARPGDQLQLQYVELSAKVTPGRTARSDVEA